MDPLERFHPVVRAWFEATFAAPTPAQAKGFDPIARGETTLLLAPTGSGKTLTAFLAAIDRLMFTPRPAAKERCRVLYVSPLKALAVDVEKNLMRPVEGIAKLARERGVSFEAPSIAVRSGDTPASDRAKMSRAPPDILITTPESLYLLLTTNARAILESVETVIVDEIHALVGTKRGAHLFVSLERLEALRPMSASKLQRIGLSATQRPLDEVARCLAGGEVSPSGNFTPRPVTIVDAGRRKSWDLKVEVPVADMGALAKESREKRDAKRDPKEDRSIWPSIHPRLVELIRAHKSTMIFANSRRLAERLVSAINEVAGEEIALAHHGSIARELRADIEGRLKRGELPAIVATSSLELGLDLGDVDLVIQIESPPSIAAGIQRIGRSGHHVGATSRGVLFPKFRGDLLACAAATGHIRRGHVESTHAPKNPLDILAQQIVAVVAMDSVDVDALFAMLRGAAPFADLSRASFEGVLDMLSGKYPGEGLSDLRPRVTWDRANGRLKIREGARAIAVLSGGTIPDRGLYGVFLAGESDGKRSRRVGELDEEMVFESRVGDVFLLGASSWRIEEITNDRVLVSPAPGQPGKMPFWHGDRPGRPPEFGRAIGELTRTIAALDSDRAIAKLREENDLDALAASNLVRYVRDQVDATGEVPSDRSIVVERTRDEVGEIRVCVLSPFGARVHAPWASAVLASLHKRGMNVEAIWSDDGMVFRFPETMDEAALDDPTLARTSAPPVDLFFPDAASVEPLLVEGLGGTPIFASHFRENAARALLLPRRRPGMRQPLWAQRKRAADLLSVAAHYPDFPIVLETMREVLRDVFDLPGLVALLEEIARGEIAVKVVDSRTPSPFAASLMFSYVATFIYDGDAPLAERRAQALTVDPSQLKALLGEAELADLLDPIVTRDVVKKLQRLDDSSRKIASADGLHDLLLALGDLDRDEIAARASVDPSPLTGALLAEGRAFSMTIGGDDRLIAIEDAARYAKALGLTLPTSVPTSLRSATDDAASILVARYAKTHGPFSLEDVAARFGFDLGATRALLATLEGDGKIEIGTYARAARSREYCDAEVLRAMRRRSLAALRKQVEPAPAEAFARFLLEWQGVTRPRAGAEALLAAIEQLEGAPLVLSSLESNVLASRAGKRVAPDLDQLCSSGEVVWIGLESIGDSDARIALYLAADFPLLAPPSTPTTTELAIKVRAILAARGAIFFADLAREAQAFPGDVLAALYELVFAGEVTNDTLAPLRSRLKGDTGDDARKTARLGPLFRARRAGPPGSEGRWSLVRRARIAATRAPTTSIEAAASEIVTETERRAALARSLLERYGVLTREAVQAEGIEGGFGAIYDVLKAMEDAGRVRRGYFVAGLAATQFALPGADDRLRALRDAPATSDAVVLAATDPANPYGAALPWPRAAHDTRPQRAAGASVIVKDGALLAYLGRSDRALLTFVDGDARAASSLAHALAKLVDDEKKKTVLIATIDGVLAEQSPLAPALVEAGFSVTSKGLFKRGVPRDRRT